MADEKHIRPPSSAGCSRAKAEGSFIALAAGDALGWPQELPQKFIGKLETDKPSLELRAWARHVGGRYHPHEEPVRRGNTLMTHNSLWPSPAQGLSRETRGGKS